MAQKKIYLHGINVQLKAVTVMILLKKQKRSEA